MTPAPPRSSAAGSVRSATPRPRSPTWTAACTWSTPSSWPTGPVPPRRRPSPSPRSRRPPSKTWAGRPCGRPAQVCGTPRVNALGGEPCSAGEVGRAVRRAQPGGGVVAGARGAQVGRAATAVGSGGHVVQRPRVVVQVGRRVGARRRGPGQREGRGDDGGGGTGAPDLQPATLAVAVVDGHTGVRVGDRGHVVVGPVGAAGVGLPGRLGVVRGAARAGAVPHRLGPATAGAGVGAQRGAADGGPVLRGGRVLDAVTTVTRGGGDRHARV